MKSSGLKKALCRATCFLLIMGASTALGQADTGTGASAPEQFVSIDFNNVDINVFIKFISELTGKNFVIDQRVKGKVTIISPAKISVEEAYRVFESVLEVHGYTTVKAGKVYKIVPSPDARSKSIKTMIEEQAGSPEDRVVTQLVRLEFADPDNIKKLFAPLISKSSVIISYQPTNMLIITDTHSNIQRLLRILKVIDIAGIGQEISVIPLEHADATDFVNILQSVFKTTQKPKPGQGSTAIKFVADERTNTVIVSASEDDTIKIKKLIALLDKAVPRGEEKIRVYRLENATAEDLAKVLKDLSSKPASGAAKGAKTAPVVSEAVQITADKATNSLIIMADKDDYLVLEEIIKQLDIPRQMVYIEALIMEVNLNKDFRLGAEWVAGGEAAQNKRQGVYGGGFSGGASGGDPGYSMISQEQVVQVPGGGVKTITVGPPLPPGFSLGIFGESVTIGGVAFPSIGAVLQAYQKDKDVHILSTPQILTTDNEEAKIHVGKNIPFQTKGSETMGTSANVYSSYEYKDVGKTLQITPQISKDRMVRLQISLEVSDLESTTEFRPTTLKRTVETTAIVKDGHTVVIGGLIDDSFSSTDYKVPCLGEIPGIGAFFSSISDANDKTNLYVFLTPRVLGTPEEASNLYEVKRDQIESVNQGTIKVYEKNLAE